MTETTKKMFLIAGQATGNGNESPFVLDLLLEARNSTEAVTLWKGHCKAHSWPEPDDGVVDIFMIPELTGNSRPIPWKDVPTRWRVAV